MLRAIRAQARRRRIVRRTSMGKALIGLINQIAESLPKSNGIRTSGFWVISPSGQRMICSRTVIRRGLHRQAI